MTKNSYTKEFKLRVLELLETSSKPLRQIAKELGVGENNLYNWRQQFNNKQDQAFLISLNLMKKSSSYVD